MLFEILALQRRSRGIRSFGIRSCGMDEFS